MKIPLLLRRAIDTGDAGFNGSIERLGSLAGPGEHWVYVYRAGGLFHGTPIVQRYCLLDRSYQPVSRPVEFSSGRELDPRILRFGEEYRILSFYHPLSSQPDPSPPNPRMRTLRVAGEGLEISEPILLENVDFPLKRVEKNWVPFLYDDRIHLVYRAEPHEILEVDPDGRCRRVHRSSRSFGWRWGVVSGGTPAVPIDGGEYLTFFHSFLAPDPSDYRSPRRYFTGAYTFRAAPPFEVTRVTPEPLTWEGLGEAGPGPSNREVVFASGLVRDGDRLILVYGDNDAASFVIEMQLEHVLAALGPP